MEVLKGVMSVVAPVRAMVVVARAAAVAMKAVETAVETVRAVAVEVGEPRAAETRVAGWMATEAVVGETKEAHMTRSV